MPEQHAVSGREAKGVAGGFFPGEMLRPLDHLAVLHAAKLPEGTIGCLVTPDALRGREHRIAAVAFLVVAVILIAVDDDFVADLPALDLGPHRPDDAGRVGTGDVIGLLVDVEHGNRRPERGPDAVVVDAGRHHENEHFVRIELPGRDHLDLHGHVGRALPVAPDGPGIHVLWNMTERWNLADLVEILDRAGSRRLRRCGERHLIHPGCLQDLC
jgi:hypothetical protein